MPPKCSLTSHRAASPFKADLSQSDQMSSVKSLDTKHVNEDIVPNELHDANLLLHFVCFFSLPTSCARWHKRTCICQRAAMCSLYSQIPREWPRFYALHLKRCPLLKWGPYTEHSWALSVNVISQLVCSLLGTSSSHATPLPGTS